MFDRKIAKDAFSMMWRFLISSTIVMMALSNFIMMHGTVEEAAQSPVFTVVMMFSQIAGIYLSMYMALWWHTLRQAPHE